MLMSALDLPLGEIKPLTEAVAHALGKALDLAGANLRRDRQPEKFTRELRDTVYRRLSLSDSQIREIEEMVRDAPARKPGKGALRNLVSLVQSLKNGGPRWLESHTVERQYFYNLERNPTVLGYVSQVRCRGVGKNSSSPALDFLVFFTDRILLVECKSETDILRLSEKKPDEWLQKNGVWTNSSYATFAKRLGIDLEVFVVGGLFSIELQNAELIHAELVCSMEDRALMKRAAMAIRERPLTIDQLAEIIPGFTFRTAARMLAERTAFGLERIISLGDTDTFLLFNSTGHCDAIDAELWPQYLGETAELRITDRLLLACPKHVEIARRRWERLQAIAQGDQPETRKMASLWKLVRRAIENGASPLEACLSNHAKCGNREHRLTRTQRAAIRLVVRHWNKGKFPDRDEAWFQLDRICQARSIRTPHKSTLNRFIRATDQTRRTLRVDGIRQYQKEKARTDGSNCSLSSVAYGHTLIVDSSNFDQRVAYNLLTLFPSAVPRFYAGVDGATGYPMAHALLFGPARTDGLAILMREFVSRHGFLPRCIQLDRGPENTGSWIKGFAEHFGIELRWPPTAGSRWNGQAENVIGRVNHAVAHKGPGSTLPDQFGRATDGRLKSRKTATKGFEAILRKFEEFYYVDLANTRDAESLSPTDRRDYLISIGGVGGKPCQFDDAFRVLTSIPIEIPKRVELEKGIRLVEGAYAGAALNIALRNGHITELRKDCINPALVYARVASEWFRAFRRDCVPLLARSTEGKLFKLLSEPQWRSERASHNLELKRAASERRLAEMEAALPGKEHLTTSESKNDSPAEEQPIVYPKVDWSLTEDVLA